MGSRLRSRTQPSSDCHDGTNAAVEDQNDKTDDGAQYEQIRRNRKECHEFLLAEPILLYRRSRSFDRGAFDKQTLPFQNALVAFQNQSHVRKKLQVKTDLLTTSVLLTLLTNLATTQPMPNQRSRI